MDKQRAERMKKNLGMANCFVVIPVSTNAEIVEEVTNVQQELLKNYDGGRKV